VRRHHSIAVNARVQRHALYCMSVFQRGKVQLLADFLETECAFLQAHICRIYTRTRQKTIRSDVYVLID
jgi:hypothetical protein